MNPCGQQLPLQQCFEVAQCLHLKALPSPQQASMLRHTCAVQYWDLAGPAAGPHIHGILPPLGFWRPSRFPGWAILWLLPVPPQNPLQPQTTTTTLSPLPDQPAFTGDWVLTVYGCRALPAPEASARRWHCRACQAQGAWFQVP